MSVASTGLQPDNPAELFAPQGDAESASLPRILAPLGVAGGASMTRWSAWRPGRPA
jgi:hypothetical protein